MKNIISENRILNFNPIKFFICITTCGILISCSSTKQYYYIEPFKEMEIRLILFPDSTYHLYDNIGCNRFDFTGRFSSVSSDSIWDICIIRSVNRNEPIMPKHYPIIKINRNDTIAIFFKKRLLIDGNSFIKKRKIWDSYLIRSERKYLVEYYVKILGKKGFIEMLAKGESMKEAKRNIMKCMKAEEVPTVDSLFKNQSMLLNR